MRAERAGAVYPVEVAAGEEATGVRGPRATYAGGSGGGVAASEPLVDRAPDRRMDDRLERVTRVGVQSIGCSINQAAASMLSEVVAARSIAEAVAVSDRFRDMMSGDTLSGAEAEHMGDLTSLRSVRAFPVRIKCALLAWTALEDALESLGGVGRTPC